MTKDDIIRMAREAGIDAESDTLTRYEGFVEPLTRFANLAAAAEREACADIVDNADTPYCGGWNALGISRAIRARGTT